MFIISGNQCLASDLCKFNSTRDIYHCDDTHCVPKSLVCNGIQDCPSGQDEAVSECGKKFSVLVLRMTKFEQVYSQKQTWTIILILSRRLILI